MKKDGDKTSGNEQGGIGRSRFLEENEPLSDNINLIDQEEGRMNNGTIGRDWEDDNNDKNEENEERKK